MNIRLVSNKKLWDQERQNPSLLQQNNTKNSSYNVSETNRSIIDEQTILVKGEASFDFSAVQSEEQFLFVEVRIPFLYSMELLTFYFYGVC